MRVVFMGTPDFAVPCLQALIDDKYDVCGVITQPDKPKGRGYQLTPPPVKQLALEYGIPVYQPTKMRDGSVLDLLKQLRPDIIVVTAYGRILPKEILDYPKYGCVNVHASLLPKLRGAAPIQWAILNGEAKTGVTLMQMDVGLDTGDMLYTKTTDIDENETAGQLFDRLAQLGAQTLSEGLPLLIEGKLTPIKQQEELSSYAPMLDKSLCAIDWTKPALAIHNQIRGLSPWPVAVCKLNGKNVKVHSSRLVDNAAVSGIIKQADLTKLNSGQAAYTSGRLIVKCGDGNLLEITELQIEGKKRMPTQSFLAGHKLEVGVML